METFSFLLTVYVLLRFHICCMQSQEMLLIADLSSSHLVYFGSVEKKITARKDETIWTVNESYYIYKLIVPRNIMDRLMSKTIESNIH